MGIDRTEAMSRGIRLTPRLIEIEEERAMQILLGHRCVYCGKEVPEGIDHPTLFACCGEIGHVEENKDENQI